MDRFTRRIAEFAASLDASRLTPAAVHAARRLLLDSFGCAIGAIESDPVRIACRIADRCSSTPGATVWGSGRASSVDAAAFANGVMVRYLDFNDTYMSLEASHPSDMFAAILSVAESMRASGPETLLALVVACEVEMALADSCNLFRKGFDHGLYISIGTAAGVGRLMSLDVERMGNAIALACTPNVPTRQTRSGELTMWKGCAASAAARSAIVAAQLAAEGMTGPTEAFEGRHGIFQQVTGPFELVPLSDGTSPFAIERSAIKYVPTEYNSQLPIYLALQLRKKVAWEQIDSIDVQTYNFTYTEIGSEPEKWRPTTRETADHSLPYMLAVTLMDGEISVASFSDERIRDPRLPGLMDRIRIHENAEFSQRYPRFMDSRIEAVSRSGKRFVEQGEYPKGHHLNPMTDAEVEEKFFRLCEGRMDRTAAQALLRATWSLETLSDVGELIGKLRF
ncbi:MAG TPA: MmgE/PrpD family protein [Ramlibacter sp.]|uniref:MmgE/PrpD family protein n=1 Tax=Ramlibacter sp. TaxID=1917967 RepID=UPI002C99AAAE|nr:MmgE/PrpD family protein [Ramlibacter sp.]HVZ44921.1 MmgE/PrpD family protein [Ramlibacter sp.]